MYHTIEGQGVYSNKEDFRTNPLKPFSERVKCSNIKGIRVDKQGTMKLLGKF